MRFRQQDVGGQDGKEVRRADEAAVPEDVALLEEDHDEGAVGAGLDKTKAREKTPEIDKEVEMACQERNTAQRQQLREKWTRSIEINTLYMLMALHYSTEGGVMGEAMLSLCGCLASWLGLREAWRRIGAEEDM